MTPRIQSHRRTACDSPACRLPRSCSRSPSRRRPRPTPASQVGEYLARDRLGERADARRPAERASRSRSSNHDDEKPVTDLTADALQRRRVDRRRGQREPAARARLRRRGGLRHARASTTPSSCRRRPASTRSTSPATIHGTAVDVTVTSGEETFSPVDGSSDIEFPVKVPTLADVATRLDRIDGAHRGAPVRRPERSRPVQAATAAAARGTASGAADRALLVGALVGGAGVVLGHRGAGPGDARRSARRRHGVSLAPRGASPAERRGRLRHLVPLLAAVAVLAAAATPARCPRTPCCASSDAGGRRDARQRAGGGDAHLQRDAGPPAHLDQGARQRRRAITSAGPSVAVDDPPASVARPARRTSRDGVYTVSWRTVSAVDGHISAGSFVFGVGSAPPIGPPDAAGGGTSQSGSPPAIVARWLLYLGLVALFGAAWVGARGRARPAPDLLAMAALGWILAAARHGRRRRASSGPRRARRSRRCRRRRSGWRRWRARVAPRARRRSPSSRWRSSRDSGGRAAGPRVGVDRRHRDRRRRGDGPCGRRARLAPAGRRPGLHGLGRRRLGRRARRPCWCVLRTTPAGDRLATRAAVLQLGRRRARGRRADRRRPRVRRGRDVDALFATDFGRVVIARVGLLLVLAGLGAVNRFITLRDAARLAGSAPPRRAARRSPSRSAILGLSALLVNLTPPASAGGPVEPRRAPDRGDRPRLRDERQGAPRRDARGGRRQ